MPVAPTRASNAAAVGTPGGRRDRLGDSPGALPVEAPPLVDRYVHLLPDLERRLAIVVPDATPLDKLAERFGAATIPSAEWTHQAHLRIGAWHVHHLGPAAAVDRLRSGIRSLNAAHGIGDASARRYHETITIAYVHLLGRFLAACPADRSFEASVDELGRSALSDPDYLLRFYSREVLMSRGARGRWVEPDLQRFPR